MNFLRTGSQAVTSEPSTTPGPPKGRHRISKSAILEGLIGEGPFSGQSASENIHHSPETFGSVGNDQDSSPSSKMGNAMKSPADVSDEEGCIIIPRTDLSEDWSAASSITMFHGMDRDFVFPGEQFHILVCLSAPRQEPEVITPFRVAAIMSRNSTPDLKGSRIGSKVKTEPNSPHRDGFASGSQTSQLNQDFGSADESGTPVLDVSIGESLLRMEDHKQHIEAMLHRLSNSHFFVRVCSSDEPLWSKQGSPEFPESFEVTGDNSNITDTAPKRSPSRDSFAPAIVEKGTFTAPKRSPSRDSFAPAIVEKGTFNPNACGGVARNIVKCCSLANGDIVILLQVNIGINITQDPILEVLQFEQDDNVATQEARQYIKSNTGPDPFRNLLNWLLPLDRALTPDLSQWSSSMNSSLASGGVSQRSTFPSASSSPLFSFGNFRSYSMSSLPQNPAPPFPAVPAAGSRFPLEDWDNFITQKFVKSKETSIEEPLSFRGVSLEPHRFSVNCGIQGLHVPGRRWRKKIQIIQPVDIHSFASDCNTDDLLCVQIKNIVPEHVSDIVIFVDSINVIFEEESNRNSSTSLPIACIDAGDGYGLPNLALRRGEEHSFILKPVPSTRKAHDGFLEKKLNGPSGQISSVPLGTQKLSSKGVSPVIEQYAVLVSCRSNYTESKLFFKHSTNWRPRIARELMLSVTSGMSKQNIGLNGGLSQLPVQVLTLQASNLTSEDLTLTVLAPASFTSPFSVVSLNSTPSTPTGSLICEIESKGKRNMENRINFQMSSSENQEPEQDTSDDRKQAVLNRHKVLDEFIPDASASCTHLWLQSRVPLGCVPSQSTATVRLELVPLTDGIITLDTLQVAVKEKGGAFFICYEDHKYNSIALHISIDVPVHGSKRVQPHMEVQTALDTHLKQNTI